MSCNRRGEIFEEAINHCRWKKNLKEVLGSIRLTEYKEKNFKEIFTHFYKVCQEIDGIGMLTVYDIASGICNHYNIPIDKIYIVGNGPKRAIKILDMKLKEDIINGVKLKYTTIEDVHIAFKKKDDIVPKEIIESQDCNKYESFLCQWQKDK